MVQVIPYVPSFGQQVTPHISNLIGTISQQYADQKKQRNDESILKGLDPNSSPIQQIQAFSRLSKEKQDSLSPLFTHLLKSNAKQEEANQKKIQEEQEIQQELQSTENVLKDLEELKPYVGGWFGSKTFGGPLRRETKQKRQQINTESIALEGFFRDLATKGTLPKRVFEELLNRIPREDMSEREYQGSIDGIRNILKSRGIQLPGEGASDFSLQKVPKGTKITEDVVDKILRESNNDPKKAAAKARKLGYEF